VKRSNSQAAGFLPLTEATFAIMASLAEPRHGYGIMQRVETASSGRIRLGPGTLYGVLTKLLRQHLIIRVEEEEINGERRKLYVLTGLGREVVELESRRLIEMARLAKNLMTK